MYSEAINHILTKLIRKHEIAEAESATKVKSDKKEQKA